MSQTFVAGFAHFNREHAALTAQKTLVAGISATVTILQMAGWIQEMRSRLDRKEFGAFVKGLLQWVGDEARPYLDIARTFKDFDLTRLQKLEPFTLLKLRSKRYSKVVERLREESNITPLRVQELISELIPKQPRKKRTEKDLADALLERHVDEKSGTFYYTLKEVNLSDRVGGWLKTKLESQTIGQILADIAAMPPKDYVLDQLQELQDVVEQARSLDAENRKLAQELQKRDLQIAELEAQLTELVAASTDEVALASKQLTEYQLETIELTDYSEPEQESDYLEQALEDDYLVESGEDGQNLEPEPQVIHVGDRVEIVSSRQGAEFDWQIGIVKVANTVGCVVEVLGKTLWFCIDELVLVFAVPQAPS